MLDDDFFQEVEIKERELLDDYIRGELSPQEARLFHQNFLKNESREEGLQFAAALRKKIDSTPPLRIGEEYTVVRPTPSRWRRLLFALATLLVILPTGTSIYVTISLNQEEEHVASLNRQLEEIRERNNAGVKQWRPENELAIESLLTGDRSGTTREGSLSEISLAPGIRAVQFILPVPKGFKSSVSVKLRKDTGQSIADSVVFPQDIGREHVLIAAFPVEDLPKGIYSLKLEADERQPHAAAVTGKSYPFKIR